MRKNRLIVIVAIIAVMSGAAEAVNIGISPGAAHFSKMLRGGYAQRTVTVSSSSNDPVLVHYEVYGQVEDWIRIDSNSTSFTIKGNEPYRMKIIVTPPSDVQGGNYTGSIRIVTDALGRLEGGTGSIVKAAVSIQIQVEIVGEEVLACRAGGFSIPTVETGYPMYVSYTVINDGNVRLRPHIEVDIWDQLHENLLHSTEFFDESILQTEEDRITKSIMLNLGVGQYWAHVKVIECDASTLATFSVVEKGAIADQAELVEVNTKAWARVGEIVPITAVFRNTGVRPVFAYFKGKIMLGEQIMHLLQTDEIEVAVGSTINFTEFYVPKQPGQHVVTGRVNYNKKLTYEKGSVINVQPAEQKGEFRLPAGLRVLPIAIYITILLVIIIILSKIRRKRF
ncbi:MAG: hypothetical protein ABIF10_04000 [Candidatus Woesearchaeota archaeon]